MHEDSKMNKQSRPHSEQRAFDEFCSFVEAAPVQPEPDLDARIYRQLDRLDRWQQWQIFSKFAFIQSIAGFITLFFCPQFGIGWGSENHLLHHLHERLPPFGFYLVCGIVFISIGAAVCGVVANQFEQRLIRKSKNLYFPIYAVLVLGFFTLFGESVSLAYAGLPWLLGVFIGSLLGYETMTRLKSLISPP